MGILRAYLDDSGKANDPQHNLIVVGGFISTVEVWSEMESRWNRLLVEMDIPFLHMKLFAHGHAPFERFKGDEAAQNKLLWQFTKLLRDLDIFGVGAVVRLAGVHRFNREFGLEINPLSLGIFANMLHCGQAFPAEEIEIVIDRIERPYLAISHAMDYARSDASMLNLDERITASVIPKSASYKNMPAIQAADFLVWEQRRVHTEHTEWHESEESYFGHGPVEGIDLHKKRIAKWEMEKFGRTPASRQAYTNLALSVPSVGLVWDYRLLKRLHDARAGVWK